MAAPQIQPVDVENLLLDKENPRLPNDLQPRTQEAMIEYIASKGAIEDLMSSIGKNGFFPGEALVAYQHPNDTAGKLRIIEGNRRLTAVKLILDPSLARNKPTIRELSDSARYKNKLKQLPVVKFETRAEVLPYLGSRHIVGVRQWEPLAKARYMKQLYDASVGESTKAKYRAVAEKIGSHKRTDYIKSNLDGLAVYNVIEKQGFFNVNGLTEESVDFGTLYTAVGYDAVAAYVGAAKKIDDNTYDRLEPIASPRILKTEKIENLTRWLYEVNEDGETVLGESRNLPMLAKVLATPAARQELEDGAALDIAYSYTSGITDDLTRYMQEARKMLRLANGVAASSTPNKSTTRLAGELYELAENLLSTIERKEKTERRRAK